jgi:hypothetical protein
MKFFFYWLSVHHNVCASQSSMFLFQWITFSDIIFNASQHVGINTLIYINMRRAYTIHAQILSKEC